MRTGRNLTIIIMAAMLTSCGGKDGKSGLDKIRDVFTGEKDDDDDGGGGSTGPGPINISGEQPSPLSLVPELQSFTTCEEAEDHIEERLVQQLKRDIDNQIRWLDDYDVMMGGSDGADSDESVAPMADGKSDSNGPDEFTTTNNQVEGVEEADFVKNTGTHIYHLSGGKLRVMQSWPADSMKSLSELEVAGRARQMLLADDKLVIIGQPYYKDLDPKWHPRWHGEADIAYDEDFYDNRVAWDFVTLTIVDVTDKTSPKIQSDFVLKGSSMAARRIGNTVRLVLNDYRAYPEDVVWWLPWEQSRDMSKEQQKAAYLDLFAKGEKIIREKTLDQWLHADAFVKREGDVKTPVGSVSDCTRIHAPNVSTEFGLTRIATLDLASEELDQTVLLTYASQLYSSKTGMYLSTPYWWWNDESMDTDFTFIHKFDVSGEGSTRYLGSGGVEGSLLNQFSMDEYNDHLRIVTTITRRDVESDDVWGSWTTTNQLSVLALEENKLNVIGKTQELAEGERVYSARFVGDRGFVVTFRQVDPLFAIDLSTPTEPTVMGELKIPGFSNYMQMLDDNHILAIGRDADEEGRVNPGLKLSIFDVSDMNNPQEAHTKVLSGSFWTEAQYDHKAFTYFKSKGVLAIPVTGYRDDDTDDTSWRSRYKSSLMVFNVSAEQGIDIRGEVDMTDIYVGQERSWGWWGSAARVNRSIFADDFVYAISNLGIRATTLDQLTEPVGTVRYECDDQCFDHWYYW